MKSVNEAAEAKLHANIMQTRVQNEKGLHSMRTLPGYHTGMDAMHIHNMFAAYFCSQEGHIPWQDEYAMVTDLEE